MSAPTPEDVAREVMQEFEVCCETFHDSQVVPIIAAYAEQVRAETLADVERRGEFALDVERVNRDGVHTFDVVGRRLVMDEP